MLTLTPHPDFRIFLLVDPLHGELSRPLRNRGVELFIRPLDLENEIDVKEIATRANHYTKSTAITTQLFNSLGQYRHDRKYIAYFIAAAKKYETEISAGISQQNAVQHAIQFASSLLVSSMDTGVDSITISAIILASSDMLVSSPVHFQSMEIVGYIVGAIRNGKTDLSEIVKTTVLRLPPYTKDATIKIIQSALTGLASENICSFKSEILKTISDILDILTVIDTNQDTHSRLALAMAGLEINKEIFKCLKMHRLDKKGKILGGGLIAAGLQDINRTDPCLTPLAQIRVLTFRIQAYP